MPKRELGELVQRAGGEEKIREILYDFYQRMAKDPMIGFFFDGRDVLKIAEGQLAFFLFASGFTSRYTGKSPTTAHVGLPPILPGHFDRRLILLRETLTDHQLSVQDIEAWIEFEDAFRGVIVK